VIVNRSHFQFRSMNSEIKQFQQYSSLLITEVRLVRSIHEQNDVVLRHKYLCRFKRKLNKMRLSPFWFRLTSCRHVAVLVCRLFGVAF